MPGATDVQIAAHLYNEGSLRSEKRIASALRHAGLGASSARIRDQLRSAKGAPILPTATDDQIAEHLYKNNGSLRTQTEVASALRDVGKGASGQRIFNRLQVAKRKQDRGGATAQ
jgi:hypothetical protein